MGRADGVSSVQVESAICDTYIHVCACVGVGVGPRPRVSRSLLSVIQKKYASKFESLNVVYSSRSILVAYQIRHTYT